MKVAWLAEEVEVDPTERLLVEGGGSDSNLEPERGKDARRTAVVSR